MESPRALAMGGAQNALGVSTGALYMNPANLAMTRVYHFEGQAAFSPEARRQSYGGAIADSSTGPLAGGAAASYNLQDPGGIHREWTDIRGTLAYQLGEHIAIGATGRYLRVNQSTGNGPFGSSLISDGNSGAPVFDYFTFDAGLTITPTEGLHIGVVGHNLTNPGSLAPTTLAAGIGYQGDIFALEGDVLTDFSTWTTTKERLMIGGELFLAGHVPLRVGYRYDDGTRVHSVSGGLGYVDRRFSIEAGVRQDIVGDHPDTMIGLAVRYFYEAAGPTSSDADAL
jgi:hypothetical protein